jgi:glycosyltransferase involved in cell wall biosynthesis
MAIHGATDESRPGAAHVGGRVPSILAVTSELPWPLDTGGHLRTFHLLRALARRFRVRLVAPAEAWQVGPVDALRDYGLEVVPVPVGPRTRWREALRAAGAAARREPYVLYRRHARGAVRSALLAEADRVPPDVIYLDHLDSWLYRAALPRVPAVVDLHNVYSVLTRRAAAGRPTAWTRRYLEREASLLGRVEGRVARTADALLTVSEEDRLHFASLGSSPIHLVPNGVDCSAYADLPAGRRSPRPVLLYVGSLSWGPNVAAARTLAVEVLPKVRERIPWARVRLVGRDPGPEVTDLARLEGVEVFGSVPDVLPHLRDATLLVVPLEAGGGTRLKILEAFAAGLPVVSTPVGCEGIAAVHGEHLLIAPRSGLADAVAALVGDPAHATRMAERARSLARDRYDWGVVGAAACGAIESVISARGR